MKWWMPLLALLSACTFEPKYCPPCQPMPSTWRVSADLSTTECNLRWWEELGDPVLDALILQALEYNNDLREAVWRVCDFYGRYQILSHKLYPQVESSGFALKERFSSAETFQPENFGFNPIQSVYRYDFSFSWEIDLWGRVRSLSHEGVAELLGSVENQRNVLLQVVSSVAHTYILLRELDCELEIAKKTQADRAEYVRLADLRFKGGLTSEIELEQALSIYEETRAAVTKLEEEIPLVENLLSVLVGVPPTCIERGKSIWEFDEPLCIPTGVPCDILVQRPDIMEAEFKLLAANARIGAARAAFFPTISLGGLVGNQSFELNNLFKPATRIWDIGGSFLAPIFTGGRLSGQLRVATARKEELCYAYKQAILRALEEVNNALIEHEQNQKLVGIEKQRVKAVATYLKLSWLRYYNGQNDYLTVLDAERQLFAAQIDEAKAQGSLYSSLVSIYKSVGGGWVIDADQTMRKK